MKIYLVGFMGSGKSLIGKLLAKRLGLGFIDLDTVLENNCGQSIATIFTNDGEQRFRELEAENLRATGTLENVVIATGGGAPCFHNNMEWMNENGLTIFLDVPPEVLAERLETETVHRPLLQGKTGSLLTHFIKEKIEGRKGFYDQAQFVCHANGKAEEVVGAVAVYFSRFIL